MNLGRAAKHAGVVSALVLATFSLTSVTRTDAATTPPLRTVEVGDWPADVADSAGTSANPAESGLVAATIGSLAPSWTVPEVRGAVIEAGGLLVAEQYDPISGIGQVAAFSATTGSVVWTHPEPQLVSGGFIADGNTVYVAGGRKLAGNPEQIAGIDALDLSTGRTRWFTPSANPNETYVYPRMAVGGGLIYLAYGIGGVAALRESDGSRVWAGPSTYLGSVAYANGVVYTTKAPATTVALDARTGRLLWTGAANGSRPGPSVIGGRVIVAGFDTQSVAAFSPGCSNPCQPLWAVTVPGKVSSVAAAGNNVAVGAWESGENSVVEVLDIHSGAVLWSAPSPGEPLLAAAGGVVYSVDGSGPGNGYNYIRAWSSAGCGQAVCADPLWQWSLPDDTAGQAAYAPVIAHGRLYVSRLLSGLTAFAPGTGSVAGQGFVAVTPARVFDATVGPSATSVAIAGRGGVPVNATAVVMTVEVTSATANGFVRVTPYGVDTATATQEFAAGRPVSDSVSTKLVNGRVQVKVSVGSARVLMDVAGYYVASNASTYTPIAPTRILDAAVGTSYRTIAVGGTAGIPINATAAVMNVEVSSPSAAGYLRVTPYGEDSATAVQEFNSKQTVSILTTVKLNGGRAQVRLSAGTAAVIVDVAGYYSAGSSGSAYVPVNPTRILSSHVGASYLAVAVAGLSGVPSNATAVVANVEIFAPAPGGYVRVTPFGQDTATATQEFSSGESISNLVVVKVVDGQVQVRLSAGGATVLIDVCGYFVSGS